MHYYQRGNNRRFTYECKLWYDKPADGEKMCIGLTGSVGFIEIIFAGTVKWDKILANDRNYVYDIMIMKERIYYMKRIDENEAAKNYMAKLVAGVYPLERAKNDGTNYCDTKEERDTEAVRESVKSELFEAFKRMG